MARQVFRNGLVVGILASCLGGHVNAGAIALDGGAQLYHQASEHQEQHPVYLEHKDNKAKLQQKIIHELKVAEITPTVFDEFVPLVTIDASWKHDSAQLGNTIDVSDVQKAPDLSFTSLQGDTDGERDGVSLLDHPQITVALTDPDAPSRDDPRWSEMCHWLITYGPSSSSPALGSGSIGTTSTRSRGRQSRKSYEAIYEYYSPGPPPRTGKHRYVLVVLVPRNGTREPLSLEKPGDRRHWGFDYHGDRVGVSEWARRNGLAVVGANFFYAINEKQ